MYREIRGWRILLIDSSKNLNQQKVICHDQVYPESSFTTSRTGDRANANRISGEVSQSDSDRIPYVTNFSVYSGVTSIFLRNLTTRTKSKLLYTGALIATVGGVINFDNHTYTTISIVCTNSTSSNPCAITTYNHGNISFLIDNNVSVAISNGNSILQFVFTSTGIRVVGTSGSPIVKYILAE